MSKDLLKSEETMTHTLPNSRSGSEDLEMYSHGSSKKSNNKKKGTDWSPVTDAAKDEEKNKYQEQLESSQTDSGDYYNGPQAHGDENSNDYYESSITSNLGNEFEPTSYEPTTSTQSRDVAMSEYLTSFNALHKMN